MNKGQLMDLVLTEDELRNCDTALPQPLYDKIQELGVEPFGKFAYLSIGMGGKPIDLMERFYLMYQNSQKLLHAATECLRNNMDRGDAWEYETDDKDCTPENMVNEFKHLYFAIKQIQDDIEKFKPELFLKYQNLP